MTGAAPQAGENYNIDKAPLLVRRNMLKAVHFAKRGLKHSFVM
jgi:hypothetical protein